MLIVVVIIGILAAALIPRLQSVQGRARDTKRKADLSQIGSALAVYKSDFGSFSGLAGTTNTQSLTLTGSYLTATPVDSDVTSWNMNAGLSISGGGYGFEVLQRNGVAQSAFGLMARTETDGSSSNWVETTGVGEVNSGDVVSTHEAAICKTVAYGASTSLSGCTANKANADLRYVYFQ